MPEQARCYVQISRAAIAANYRALRDAVGPGVGVIGVVKADAYGHGTVEVSRILCREGAAWLAVTSVEEGITLRAAGITCRILVMAGIMAWEHQAVREFELTPVVHSLDELRMLNEGGAIDVHLKIDTGMDRLGTRATATDIAAAITSAPRVHVEGLMSHFASPTDFTSSQTDEQIRNFRQMATALSVLGVRPPLMHFSSTNAIAYPRPAAWLSLVRPGHAIYGYVSPARGPAPHALFTVRPALSWKARIIAVKDVPAGARIGYGGSFVAHDPMRIAVLAAGYADGIPHRLSNRGKVIAGGRFAPIVGTVSMDLTTIDISHSPEMQPGDEVTLLGREGDVSLDAQQIARTAGTISYNVLCGIAARVKRVYTDT
ncbi:MAG: alanine racemase [Acidobacteriota bacterium]|nr:alanine racemase [Acidobacteriota bacterium]